MAKPKPSASPIGRGAVVRHNQFGNGKKTVAAIIVNDGDEFDGRLHVDLNVFVYGMSPRSLSQVPLYDKDPGVDVAPAVWFAGS